MLSTGIFIGAMIWWTILSNLVNMLRHRIGLSQFNIINKISGSLIFGFGGYELLSSLINYLVF